MPMLEVEGLSARYGHVEALRRVDLHVDDGELVAVLGPNGAGKSTLMRALLGLVPTDGRVRFCGAEVPPRNPVAAAMRGIVLVPEGRGIFAPMTVAENLELGAYLLRGGRAEFARRHERVLTLFPRLKERLSQVSGLAVGRRTANAGDRPRADGGAEDPSARRTFARSRTADHRRDSGKARRAQSRRACRSCLSSRRRPWRSNWRAAPI